MIVFGIAFLIPLLVLMLNIVGVVKASQLSKYRVYVIFGTFVFGAVATPSTDPFSMLALALPMSLLFLVAEVIAHILDRRKAKRPGGDGEIVLHDKALDDLEQTATDATPPTAPRRRPTAQSEQHRAGGQPLGRQGSGPATAARGGRYVPRRRASACEILLSRDVDEARTHGRRGGRSPASAPWW